MIKNRFGVVAAILLLLSSAAWAQGESLQIPVRVVDGHIMVIGYLSNSSGDLNDVSLTVSFEDKGILTLEGQQYGWLANPPVVKLLLKPDVQLEFSAAEVKPEGRQDRVAMYNHMTRMYSNKLDEHKVKGVLGAGFLRKYHVALDLAAGTLTLSPPGTTARGEVVVKFTPKEGRVFIPISYADGKSGELMLGGDAYDSYVDGGVARSLGKPAGNISPVWLGAVQSGIDVFSRVALRPGVSPDSTVVAGVNLMEGLRVEVDWGESKVAFTPTKLPQYSQADFAYFQAEVEGGADALLSYLARFPSSRLSPEAALRAMEMRIQQKDVTDQQLMEGMKWVVETTSPERKMELGAGLVKRFRLMPGRDSLVAEAGTFALQYSRTAITVQDTYRLHNIIGAAYLAQDRVEEAWKHLLSAAFMPLDSGTDLAHNIEVNYNLARTYDRMGRAARAYSRYARTLEMMEPVEDQLTGMPESLPNQPSEAERQMNLLKGIFSGTKSALERLRKQIPADQLEMLEG